MTMHTCWMLDIKLHCSSQREWVTVTNNVWLIFKYMFWEKKTQIELRLLFISVSYQTPKVIWAGALLTGINVSKEKENLLIYYTLNNKVRILACFWNAVNGRTVYQCSSWPCIFKLSVTSVPAHIIAVCRRNHTNEVVLNVQHKLTKLL